MTRPIESKIVMSEAGSADHYPVWIITPQGPRPAKFTAEQIETAMDVAFNSAEKIPDRARELTLFGYIKRALFS